MNTKSVQSSEMSDELRRLLRKRTAIRGSIDTIVKYVENFNPMIHTIRQIRTRVKKLDELVSDFANVQELIVDLNEGHEDEDDRLKFEDDMYTLKTNMEDLIERHNVIENVHNVSSSCHSEAVRLPAITPPSFSGRLEEWASFIDTFNALFHNNTSLSDVQKLHYLKLSVVGEAANVLRNYKITAENYQVAYQELTNQYENKGLTIQTHIRALLKSPKVHKASAAELRQLHHHVSSHVRALQSLGQLVQHWDAWLVTIICVQLDPTTAGEWQLLQKSKELPTYTEIESFLSKRVAAFEVGDISNSTYSADSQFNRRKNIVNHKAFFTQNTNAIKCPLCSSPHKLFNCNKFKDMDVTERKDTVFKFKLCFNCLNSNHQVRSCKSSSCLKCGKRHNTQLHEDPSATDDNYAGTENILEHRNTAQMEMQPITQNNAVLHAREGSVCTSTSTSSVMLATAIIYVNDSAGQPQRCRAVLDSGSQLNFITVSCAQRLRLNKTNVTVSISGIDVMSSSAVRLMPCTIVSRCQNYQFTVDLYSLPTITEKLPPQMFDLKQFNIPDDVKNDLADPQLHVSAPIDILLGAEVFYDIFVGKRHHLSNHITLHSTKLGWILAGKLFNKSLTHSKATMLSTTSFSNSALSLFTSANNVKTSEEIEAEKHFVSSVKRDERGKFVVRLPVNNKLSSLGDSRAMAEKRFFNLEKRFAKDKELAIQYDLFISEYLQLGHMELASPTATGLKYYLPHHPVFKANSMTTKLRVVFDGSAITKTGISINDVLLKGPKVQPDIFQILLRFRIHQVAITADVEKMYRQILIAPEDRDLQRILYRKSPADQLQEYRLCTVTYGTKAASYLATRCLSEIGKSVDEPKLRRIICKDFYVDDLLSGGASEEECHDIYNSLLSYLNPAGFPLRKWCSNSVNLINRIPTACNDPTFVLRLSDEDTVTALGLTWQPITDQFRFTFKEWVPPLQMTKRTLLSDINSIYDPIGLISPTLILGKIFIQQLWSMKLNWDDILPVDLQARWIKFYNSLQHLQALVIPRKAVCAAESKITIHGFCDASKEAFGACLYLHSVASDGHSQVHLLTSKSRVAPMKATTIPRLELCGALLLSELLLEAKNELNCLGMQINVQDILLWTDSSIVLAWLTNKVPLQSYVSNRIARILDITVLDQWRHVPSTDNPADLITRGIHPSALSSLSMWWNGPSWLGESSEFWPSFPKIPAEVPEIRPVKYVLVTSCSMSVWLLNRYSNFSQAIRITALILRFIHNCRISVNNNKRILSSLTTQELSNSKTHWIRTIQAQAFSQELIVLKSGLSVHRSSCLSKLNPFVDSSGLIRVGGRLAYAPVAHDTKFPIVLPSKSVFTKLLFKYEHQRLLHVGPQALLASIQINYWPIRGRRLASLVVHQCLTCFRANPKCLTPFMAPLPRQRTTIDRPFSQCGVDFCGPLLIRSGIRRVKNVKAYISVFVCLVTRAVHLELVSSLSTEAFIAALSRFIARRGICSHIFSDNGTNFTGANRVLQHNFNQLREMHAVSSFLTDKSIQWHFIPPSAPHFGGLWEAAVKSAKKHLTKMAASVTLTYEEATTLLCQIEAVLNSRPVTPLSNDPSDYNALTPGHFLIGGPITTLPDPDLTFVPQTRLKRFAAVQQQMQHFWKRWSGEYLPQLHCRNRWIKPVRNLKIGDLCILRNETLPPTKWPLVRVQDTFPGADGIVRVVMLRNAAGNTFKRPVTKLALLPTTQDEESNL